VRIHNRSLGLAFAAAALAAVVLLVVLGNTDMAIAVAAAAAPLVGMFFLRRYARARLIYGHGPAPAGDASGPERGRTKQEAAERTDDNAVPRYQAPTESPQGQHPRVMVGDHDHLLGIGQIDTDNRVAPPAPASAAAPNLALRSPRDTPLPLPTNVLLLRWDTRHAVHQEDVPTPATTRRTCSYAAVRAGRGTLPRSAGRATWASTPTTASRHGSPSML
jgi:hypothetical protein